MSRDIDYKNLRSDLENYYGTAMFSGAGIAMSDLSKLTEHRRTNSLK